jgi:hypothetical protein
VDARSANDAGLETVIQVLAGTHVTTPQKRKASSQPTGSPSVRDSRRKLAAPPPALPADEELEKHTWAALYHAHVHHEAPEWTPTLPLSTSLNDEQRVGLRAINNMIRRASHTIPSKCVHTRCSVSGPFLPRLLGRRLSHLLTLQPNTPHQLASLNGRKALPSLLNKCNVASYQLMSTELCQANPPGTIDHVSMVSNGLHAAHTGHVT